VLISLDKREVGDAVDAPWKYTLGVSDATNPTPLIDRDLNVIYDAMGLLLILGEPGAGKTTALLDLARALLERAKDDIKERVPIVVNLSSWKKKQPIAEWISGELSEKYRVPRKIARSWLKHDYLLPLWTGWMKSRRQFSRIASPRSMRLSKRFGRPDSWFAVGSASIAGYQNA
jgi:hypothetical protein